MDAKWIYLILQFILLNWVGFDFSKFSILISKIRILAIAYGPIEKFIVLGAVVIKQFLLKIIVQCLVTVNNEEVKDAL